MQTLNYLAPHFALMTAALKNLMIYVIQHELCSMLTCHKLEQDIKH